MSAGSAALACQEFFVALSFVDVAGVVFATQTSLDKIVATCLGEQNLSGVTTSLRLRHLSMEGVAAV